MKKYLPAVFIFTFFLWASSSVLAAGMELTSKGEGTKVSPKNINMQITTPEGDITTVDIKISEDSFSFNMSGLPKKKGVK